MENTKIMRNIKLSAFVVGALLASSAMAEGQPYVFGEWGSSSFKNISPFPNPGLFELGAGYRFHQNVAAELGFSVFGDSKVVGGGITTTASPSSYHLAAVGIYPVNDAIEVFAKAGFSSNKVTFTTTGLGGATTSSSNSGLFLGLGASYKVTPAVVLRVQYQDLGKFDNVPPESSAQTVSVGGLFYF